MGAASAADARVGAARARRDPRWATVRATRAVALSVSRCAPRRAAGAAREAAARTAAIGSTFRLAVRAVACGVRRRAARVGLFR